jgi:hypothetical protein
MNCANCTEQSSICGCFPPLSEWTGNFNCCNPRDWEDCGSGPAEKELVKKQNLYNAVYDPNVVDAFAEKINQSSSFVRKEERDCFLCSYFKGIDGDFCSVCPKNKDRYYATRCVSFGVKIKKE